MLLYNNLSLVYFYQWVVDLIKKGGNAAKILKMNLIEVFVIFIVYVYEYKSNHLMMLQVYCNIILVLQA